MASHAHVERVRNLLAATRRDERFRARGFVNGIKKVGKLILDESRKIVPIDTKALYNSSSTKTKGRGWASVQETMYQMYYGIYVHENLTNKHKPGKSAKFLEIPVRQNRARARAIIREEMQKERRP